MDAFLTGSKKNVSSEVVAVTESLSHTENSMPWVEKYRPKNVDQVAFQEEVVAVLKKCLSGNDIPNMLFYGPPGTGKTSAALAFAKEIFGGKGYRDRVLELNASDERGIQVIRDKVKTFAQYAASSTRADGKPCPPLKLIILDEADSMTSAAQAALRRTMEKESKTTRFFLICNYLSRIIEPLTSRCAKFRFKPLPDNVQNERLNEICTKENVYIDDDALKILIEISEGDLRRAITSLQSAAKFKNGQKITLDDINELLGVIPENLMEEFFDACKKRRCELLEKSINRLIKNGYSAYQLIGQAYDFFLAGDFSASGSDSFKSHVIEKLATCEYRLATGADEFLQMMDFGCCIMMSYSRNC